MDSLGQGKQGLASLLLANLVWFCDLNWLAFLEARATRGSESYNCSHSCSPQCSHIPCFPGVETASQTLVTSGNKELIIPFSEELMGDEDGCGVPSPFRSVCTQVSP